MEKLSYWKEVEEMKERWRTLWRQRIDDKVRAEGIANDDYPKLFVDKGTVIFATRQYRPLNFRKILEKHKMVDVDKFVAPHPEIGGWGKFIKTSVSKSNPKERVEQIRQHLKSKKKQQHHRKGGHGWLRI